jgi:hypothetical protein
MDGPRCVGGRVADADGMGAPRAAGTALEQNHKTMGPPKMTKLIKTEAKLRKAPPLCRDALWVRLYHATGKGFGSGRLK